MTRATQILEALRKGAVTSREMAAVVPTTRSTISVTLCKMEDRGLVEKIGVVSVARAGRPCVKWRVRERADVRRRRADASSNDPFSRPR